MAVKVLELHHHGIRVGPSADEVAKARKFYGDVLGLDHDPGRPNIPTIDGFWMDVGGTAQIHLMGVNGQSKFAKGRVAIRRRRTWPSRLPTSRRRARSWTGSAWTTG
jgi:hypothetical protein